MQCLRVHARSLRVYCISPFTFTFVLFVISASDPTVFLDYASINFMNNTLETIVDSNDLEYRILTVLDYFAFLHRNLHIVNLDIKP